METVTTEQVFTHFMDQLWTGLQNTPFFDFGFSFADFFVGLVIISGSIWLMKIFLGIDGGIDSVTARAGRNHRVKKSVKDAESSEKGA